jgi:hypothetical protein
MEKMNLDMFFTTVIILTENFKEGKVHLVHGFRDFGEWLHDPIAVGFW